MIGMFEEWMRFVSEQADVADPNNTDADASRMYAAERRTVVAKRVAMVSLSKSIKRKEAVGFQQIRGSP
jgi:hypothetical protein